MNATIVSKLTQAVNDLEAMDLPPKAYAKIREMRQYIQPPPTISDILDRIPGKNAVEKAAAIGVTKGAFNLYKQGKFKPKRDKMERIEELTGIPLEVIRATQP